MQDSQIYTTALTILSAIITGGFVLVYVELSNKRNRHNDRYEQMMLPFMHKLTSYFKFVSWCRNCIKYPKPNERNEGEKQFHDLVHELGGYGGRAIVSGGDYSIDKFSANQIYDLSNKANQIWYIRDRMNPCRLEWQHSGLNDEEYIHRELTEVFPHYAMQNINLDLFTKVSFEFFVEVYQPIEYDTYYHEVYLSLLRRQTYFVSFAVVYVLILLASMLFISLPALVIQVGTLAAMIMLLISLMLLGINEKVQIRFIDKIIDKKDIFKNMKGICSYKLLEPVGLLLLLGAFCWQCISSVYYNHQRDIREYNQNEIIYWIATMQLDEAIKDSTRYHGKQVMSVGYDSVSNQIAEFEKDKVLVRDLAQKKNTSWYIQIVFYLLGSIMIVVKKTIEIYYQEKR